MDSSEGKGRLIDQARAARLRRKRKLISSDDNTSNAPQGQIDEQTDTEGVLNASEAEYRATLDAMRDAIHVVDRDLRVVLINEKLRKWSQECGLDVSHAVGRTLLELFPFLSDSVKEEYTTVFEQGRIVNTEDIHSIGGKEIIAEVRRLPIFESGRVARVVTIIRDITERKRSEHSLRRSEEMLAEAQQIAGVLSWNRNLLTGEVAWSENAYTLLDLERGKVTPSFEVFLNTVHADDREGILTEMREAISQGRLYRNQLRIVHRDGTIHWFDAQAQVRVSDTGEPVEVIGVAQDITERKMAEEALRESESRYRAVVENAGEGIVVVQDGKLQLLNPYVEAAFGRTQEELKSCPFLEFVHPDDRERVMDLHIRRFRGEEVPPVYEFRVIDIHGNTRWAENNGLLIEWCGRPATLNFLRDITDRKRAEEALKISELRIRSLIEHTTDAVFCYEYDPPIPTDTPVEEQVKLLYDGVLMECNDVCARTYGAQRAEEVIGKKLTELFGTTQGSLDELFTQLIEGGYQTIDGEGVEKLEDGTERHYLNNGHGVVENGKLIRVWGTFRDVTEHKKAAEALQQSNDLLRESQKVANLGHYLYDITADRWESSEILDEVFGIGPAYPKTTEGWLQIVHPDDRAGTRVYLSQTVLEQGQPFDHEYRIVRPADNQVRWVHGLGRLEFDGGGKPIRMIGTIQDITERLKAREAIRLSEEKYRRVVEDQTEFIVRWLPGGIRTFVNESYCRYFRISRDEAIGTSCWPLINEDFHRSLGEKIESLTPGNPVSTDELMVIRPDGTTGWNSWTTRALFDERDELIEYQAVGCDITERKRAEGELARQRYYLSRAQDIGSMGTWDLDIAKNSLFWTDENYRIFGLPLGTELTYEAFLNCVHPEDKEYVDSKWKAAINGEPYDIEHRILAEGDVKWVREKADLEFDEQGNCIRAIGFTQDITKRRQTEQTLRDSEEKFRQLVENINEIFWLQEVDSSQVLFVSPAYESVWGQARQSIYDDPNNWIDSIHPDDRLRVADAFAAGRIDGTYCEEYRIIRPDGSIRWIWDRSFPIHGHDGKVERIAGIAEDVTQRKEAEEQLRESQERFRHAFENANVGMCLVDMSGIMTRVNSRMCDIFGYEAGRLQGMDVNEIAHPEDVDVNPEFIRRSVSGEIESTKFEKRYFRADGNMLWCQISSSLVRDGSGRPLYFISHVQDITERRKTQDAVEDRLKFERLLSGISSRFVNLAAQEIDHAIEDGLGQVGRFFGVDRVSIGQFVGSEKRPQTTHSWLAEGCVLQSGPEAVDTCYPNAAARLIDEGKVAYESPQDIPDAWTQERQFAEANGIKAGLVVALRVGGTVIGAVGINSLQAERCWPDETAERLRLVGDIFANALQRKRVEDALIESEAKFKSLAEQSPNMIFINKQGKVVYANNRCEEVMGYTRQQLYHPDFDFLCLIAPESHDMVKDRFAMHMNGQEVQPYDYSLIDKNGRRIDAINTCKLIQYEGQAAILGIVTDITDRKCAERQLRESEEKFRSYIDNAPDGVVVADRHGRHIEVNEAICNMTGYSKDEFLFISLGGLLTTEYQQAGREHFEKVINEGRAAGEFAYLRKDGSMGYWSIDAVRISEDRFLAFVKDITENKRAEEALRASEEKFRSIFETAPNMITSVDERGVIVDCNRRILDILGYEKEEVVGESMAKIIHPDCLSRAEKALQEILDTGFSYNKEYKMVRKDGSLIDVSINCSGLKDRSSRQVRTLCIIDNITDRKQAEQRILENRAQLKSLASQLSLTEERERRRLATELHDHIGQSLVISKIKLDQLRESAAVEPAEALQEVCSCLEQVIQDTRMLTFDLSSPILYELGFEAAVAEWLADEVRDKYGIQTEFEDDGLPKSLDEDIRALLFRNVRELLINAVKHASAGKVKVSLRTADSHIEVTVEDDGVGFDPIEVRARAAQRAEFGLFSIRERLEQLGGRIEIESGPGRGTRISMAAPLKSEDNS